MGDQNSVLTANEARHLLRRTGFGAPVGAVNKILDASETRGHAADRLLAFTSVRFKPGGRDFNAMHNKWVKRMLKTATPLQEKLVLFWHDHFATSYAKVGNVKTMANQNRLLRQYAKGDFKAFVKAINKDAAMIEFLDTSRNYKDYPNENYARELQELFTLGVVDFAGQPNYDQEDIVQIARAFTGWGYRWNTGETTYGDWAHDYMVDWPARGPKVIYKTRGGFGAAGADFATGGEGQIEGDAVIDVIFQHTDSQGKNTVARYIARKLFSYFGYADPAAALIDSLIAQSSFDTSFNIGALLRAILVHDEFYAAAAAAPFTAATKKSVKWPVDYVVSTMRLFHMRLKSRYQYVDGGSGTSIETHLTNMGQTLLQPPSVFGWDWETSWISSSTLMARYNFARDIIMARNGGAASFRPKKFFDLSLTDSADIVDAATEFLAITDQLTASERSALISYLGGPLDLQDPDTQNTKLNGLFGLLLQSPAYQLH